MSVVIPTFTLTPDPPGPTLFAINKSPLWYPSPPSVTFIDAILLLALTTTVALHEFPNPVKDENSIFEYVPCVIPIPVLASNSKEVVPDKTSPAKDDIFPTVAPCIISLPLSNVVVVDAIEINCLFEYAVIGLFFLILVNGSSVLKKLTAEAVFVTNFALLSLNLRSSNWLGVQVVWFWDLNNDPRYGCLL